MVQIILILWLLLFTSTAFGQTTNSRTQAGDGTPITDTIAGRLDVQTQSGLALDATLTSRFPAAGALADDAANPTLSALAAYLLCFDGTTWDRCRGALTEADDNSIASGQSTSFIINGNHFYNGSAWVRMLGDATDGLLVNLGANNDVTVTGSVTANAGTNLNTSALGLEATLQSILTELGQKTEPANTQLIGDGAGALNVIVDSSALPTGAATAALQDGIVKDGAGDTTQANVSSGRLHTDGSGVTQPISAAALPLPAGASTAALQDGILKDGAGDTTQANVSSGRLHVDGSGVTQPVSGTVTVTDGAGALNVICDSGCGGAAAFEDNDAFVANTTPVNILGALYDVTPPAITDGNAGAVRMNSNRALLVDGSAVTQPISGTVTVTDGAGALNVIVDSSALPSGAATAALQDGIIKDGAGDTTQANVSTGRLHVDGSGVTQPISGTVTVGTFPDNEPFNLAQIATTAIAAHDGNTLENPLLSSGYAETPEDSDANTNGNRVSADGDKVRVLADRNGTQFVRDGPPHQWVYHENSSSALTDTTVHASCGTGLFNYIKTLTFSTNAATAASILIEDSTTATILGPYYLEAVAGRGMHLTWPQGRKQTTAATLISVTTTGAIAHGLDITGFCAP